jgi:hypothetical protein
VSIEGNSTGKLFVESPVQRVVQIAQPIRFSAGQVRPG